MARRIYISGPMTGLPDHNYPAFHAAADRWAHWGWEVFNPAENFGGATDRRREEYMRLDFIHVMNSHALALLPGWQRSPGAKGEVVVAKELGLEFFDAQTGLPVDVFIHIEASVVPVDDPVDAC